LLSILLTTELKHEHLPNCSARRQVERLTKKKDGNNALFRPSHPYR
jgi:hypothetical protein